MYTLSGTYSGGGEFGIDVASVDNVYIRMPVVTILQNEDTCHTGLKNDMRVSKWWNFWVNLSFKKCQILKVATASHGILNYSIVLHYKVA